MTKQHFITLVGTTLLMTPLLVSAQGSEVTTGLTTLGSVVDTFTQTIVKSLATLFATLAMVAFFYGIVQYIWGLREGKQDQITKGNQFMIYGLLALFVMFSVWGIIQYAQGVFGIKGQNMINIPQIKFGGSGGGGTLPAGTNPSSGSLPVGANPGTNSGDGLYTCPDGTRVQPSDAKYCNKPSSSNSGAQGASCTGSGQSTCDSGLSCVTTGEGYNTCQPASSGGTGLGAGDECVPENDKCQSPLKCLFQNTGGAMVAKCSDPNAPENKYSIRCPNGTTVQDSSQCGS